MQRPKCRISVIVPAYNAAAYLTQCYNSVCAQSVTDWEMLIVENGSTDDTATIGGRLSQQDSRVRLLHSEKGVSRARNLGIDEARGEFITFLDADDELSPNAFEVFLRAAAHSTCDVIVGATEGAVGGQPDKVYEGTQVDEALVMFLCHSTRYLTVWGKLYRTDFLQHSAVRFNPMLTHAEDSDYLIRLLADCRGVAFTDKAVYRYNTSNTSAVRGQAGVLADKYYAALQATAKHIASCSDDIKQAFHFTVLDNLLVVLVHDIFCSAKSAREQRADAAALLNKPLFSHALAHAPLSQAPIVKRIAYIAAKKKHLRLLQLIVRVRQWQKKEKPMMTNVLVFGMNDNPGGMESFIMSYYRRIDRERVRFDFLTNCPTIAYEDEIRALGGQVYKICARSKNPRLYREQLTAFFTQHAAEYQVFWMNTCSLANIDYLKMAKVYRIPCRIIHSHNSQNMDSALRGLLHKLNKRTIANYATDFWACSRKAGEFFYSPAILASDRYREIHNAIDCDRFTFDPDERQAVREEFLLTDKLVIGHIGRLHFQKNQTFLLDVFARAHAIQPNARLLIIGQGEDDAMLKEKVAALGLNEAVIFTGVRNDIPRLLQGMDVFALPSLFEGLPVVLVETQAAGLAAVVADTVSEEAKLTEQLTFLPLDAGVEDWAHALLDAAKRPRADGRAALAAAGYDIRTEAAVLQALLEGTREDV